MWLMGEHWPFICPFVPFLPAATEFDYGTDNSEVLEKVPEPCEKHCIDGGDLRLILTIENTLV